MGPMVGKNAKRLDSDALSGDTLNSMENTTATLVLILM